MNINTVHLSKNGYLVNEVLTVPASPGNRHYSEVLEWIARGNTPEPEGVPTLTQQDYTNAIQSHLDIEAQELGYDSIFTAVTYADEDSVLSFQQDGQSLRAWRSLVWAKGYEVLAEVQAETRTQPTIEELLSELPVYE